MADDNTNTDMNKALFVNMVMMLTSSAMQQLGKLVDPETDKAEINLEGAQISIDMLSMLRDKTKGNLDDDENKMINDSIASLQMNYFQTASDAKQGETKADQAAQPETAAKPETEEKPDLEQAAAGKDPKFHKSYGT